MPAQATCQPAKATNLWSPEKKELPRLAGMLLKRAHGEMSVSHMQHITFAVIMTPSTYRVRIAGHCTCMRVHTATAKVARRSSHAPSHTVTISSRSCGRQDYTNQCNAPPRLASARCPHTAACRARPGAPLSSAARHQSAAGPHPRARRQPNKHEKRGSLMWFGCVRAVGNCMICTACATWVCAARPGSAAAQPAMQLPA